MGLQTLFLIDVSRESYQRGFLKAVCEGISQALYGEDGAADGTENDESSRKVPVGSKVGIVTFDSEVHFYNLTVCKTLAIDTFRHIADWDIGIIRTSADDGHDGSRGALRSIERGSLC